MTTASQDLRIELIEALIALSRVDLPCSDLYLGRAEALLAGVLNAPQYRALRRECEHLPRLAREVRELVERGDWAMARAAAKQAQRDRQRLADNQRLLALGDAVYGPRIVSADTNALAIGRIIPQPAAQLDRLRTACAAQLQLLLAHDADGAALYRARLKQLDGLTAVDDDTDATTLGAADLRQRIIEAAAGQRFDQVETLCTAALHAAPPPTPSRSSAGLRLADPDCPLAAAFPDAAVSRAEALGLRAVTVPADALLNGYVACGHVHPEAMPGTGPDTAYRNLDADDRGPPRAPALSSGLRDTLDLLMLHPFVSSLGSRYVPDFGAESVLLETFPETEPDTRTGLLDALAMRGRHGVSRLVIEDAVRTRGPRLCAELGLDPMEHVVVPVPFDVYIRLAPRFEWGRQRLWTHFDGYQLTRGLSLRALVGGDAHYGGPEDLCSVARDYESDRLVARFAILRRQRFATPLR
jgi:hypothetical protein